MWVESGVDVFFLMIRRPPRSTQGRSSAASDVYKGQAMDRAMASGKPACVNVKCRGVISPIVAATSDKRDKASIE